MAYRLATRKWTFQLVEPLPKFLEVGDRVDVYGGWDAGSCYEILAISNDRSEIQVCYPKRTRDWQMMEYNK